MPKQITVNEILEKISIMPVEDQEFVAETVSKRVHDVRRTEISDRAKEAEKNYKKGKVSIGTPEDLIKDLENIGWSLNLSPRIKLS